MNCKNCETPVSGNFCINCGQKSEVHRITFSHLTHELVHAFTHADKGFLLLIKELITKPGIVAKEYIEGKRKRYFNPLSFLVITAAAQAFVSYKVGYFRVLTQSNHTGRGAEMRKEVMEITVNNGKLLELILIFPCIALFSWLLFKRSKYNLAENFVLPAYLIGEMNVFRIFLAIPLFLVIPSQIEAIDAGLHLIQFVFFVVAYKQFFNQNIFLTIGKIFLIIALYIIFYWATIYGYVYLKNLIF